MMYRLYGMLDAANRLTTRFRVVLGALMAGALAGLLALYNVSSGPLHNLNDIGGWSNRALFIVLAACVHALLLLVLTLMHRKSFAHLALRQLTVTVGFYIMLLAINHKAYAYLNVLQPVVRAMDEGGLAAGAAMETGLSAPMLLVVYLITRGPVYDMYLLKLFAIAGYLALVLLMTLSADRHGLGLRAEVLLALCMVMPQGFMLAAFSAMPEIASVVLLGVSLLLLAHQKQASAALVYGAACALSGVSLYALPLYVYAMHRGALRGRYLAAGAGLVLFLCLPAVLCGMPAGRALASLVQACLGLPQYASGAPGWMNLVPFAVVEHMPQYAPVLSHFEALDTVTYAQQYYTQAHYEQLAAGMVLAGLAIYAGLCALCARMTGKSPLERALMVTLGALMVCPGATGAAWLAADLLCLYALVAAPKLRLPACMVLFATMTSASYPMTEEVMLPMVYAFALCLCALLMLLDVIPMGKEETLHE